MKKLTLKDGKFYKGTTEVKPFIVTGKQGTIVTGKQIGRAHV